MICPNCNAQGFVPQESCTAIQGDTWHAWLVASHHGRCLRCGYECLDITGLGCFIINGGCQDDRRITLPEVYG